MRTESWGVERAHRGRGRRSFGRLSPALALLLGGWGCASDGLTTEDGSGGATGAVGGQGAEEETVGTAGGGAGGAHDAGTSRGGTGGAAAGGTGVETGGGAATGGSGGALAGGSGGVATGGGAPAMGGSGGANVAPIAPGQYGTRAMLLQANSETAVAELDGKIYVLGGYPSSRVTQSTVMVYDVARDAWSLAAPLPVPIHHPVAVGTAGKVYSLGGQTDAGDIARTLEYDPATNRWRDLQPMRVARGAGSAAVIGGKIYVVGGRPPAGNAFEVYDIASNQWTTLPSLPQTFPQRNHLIAAAIGGKVYVAGGRYGGGNFGSPMTASLDIFDPATSQWTRGRDLPRPRGGVNGVAANGCFFVWGGEGTNTGEPNDVFPDHDVYDPTTNTWTSLRPLPTPVHGVTGAAFVGGLIYMPGGGTMSGGTSGSRIFQVYRPDRTCGG